MGWKEMIRPKVRQAQSAGAVAHRPRKAVGRARGGGNPTLGPLPQPSQQGTRNKEPETQL